LEFYYKREISEYNADAAGKVILSFDNDAASVDPSTKLVQEDQDPHRDGLPCDPMISLKIDCSQFKGNALQTALTIYTNSNTAPGTNLDTKTYNMGKICIGTAGQNDGHELGELHVKYECELMKPTYLAGTTTPMVVSDVAANLNIHVNSTSGFLDYAYEFNTLLSSFAMTAGTLAFYGLTASKIYQVFVSLSRSSGATGNLALTSVPIGGVLNNFLNYDSENQVFGTPSTPAYGNATMLNIIFTATASSVLFNGWSFPGGGAIVAGNIIISQLADTFSQPDKSKLKFISALPSNFFDAPVVDHLALSKHINPPADLDFEEDVDQVTHTTTSVDVGNSNSSSSLSSSTILKIVDLVNSRSSSMKK
jgi:hypothetical protein